MQVSEVKETFLERMKANGNILSQIFISEWTLSWRSTNPSCVFNKI